MSSDAALSRPRLSQFRISSLLYFTFLAALFFTGVKSFVPGEEGPAVKFLMYGPLLLFQIVLIHGSWRGVPLALFGLVGGEVLFWSIFYSGDSYDPQLEECVFSLGFGCAVGTLTCSTYQLSRYWPASTVQAGLLSRIGRIMLWICLGGSVLVSGFWAHALTRWMMGH